MRLRKLIVAAGIITAMSIAMATSVFADVYAIHTCEYLEVNGKWGVYYVGTDGQILKNQWLLLSVYGDQARWVYLDGDGKEIVNGTSPDGYALDGAGIYYATATEADKAANAAYVAAFNNKSTTSSSTTTAATTTNNTTSTTTTQTATSGSYMDIGTEAFNEQVFELINDYRASKGLNRLKHDDDADAVAEIRALELPYTYTKSHARPDYSEYSTAWEDVTGERPSMTKITECALWRSPVKSFTPQEAFEAWKNSPGHNEGMLKESRSVMSVRSCVSKEKNVVFVVMENK